MGDVDSSRELKGLIVVVKVILEFGSQQNRSEHCFVYIQIVQAEIFHDQVVAINVDYCDDEALRWKPGIFVESSEKFRQGDGRYRGAVKDGVAGFSFLIDEVVEQFGGEDDQLFQLDIHR